MANTAGGLPVVSNPFIADIFADEAIAFDMVNGTIRITLATIKMARGRRRRRRCSTSRTAAW